jgi:hypothetical protein
MRNVLKVLRLGVALMELSIMLLQRGVFTRCQQLGDSCE